MASGRVPDYLGYGVAADRPAAPDLATGCIGLWWSTDTSVLSVWDGAWEDVTGGGGGSYDISALDVAEDGLAGGDALGIATIAASPASEQVSVGSVAALASGALVDPTTDDYDFFVRKVTAVTTLAVGFIGDSITSGSTITTPPTTAFATAASTAGVTITATNEAVAGAVVADFVPGTGAYAAAAKAQFVTDGVRIVHIMIGTNDCRTGIATSQADFRARLLSICEDYIASGFLVAIAYPPYMGETTGAFDAGSPGLVLDYIDAIDSLIDNQHIFRGDSLGYVYYRENAGTALQVDGVHPTQTGSDTMAVLWAAALRPILKAITGQVVFQRAVVGSGLSLADSGGVLTLTASGSGGLNVQSVVDAATVTPTFANDVVKVTAQAQALTLADWTGTAAEGHGIAIRIKDNGTVRAISYGAKYRAIDVTLPTTTASSKTLYLGCIYNETDDKIDVVSVAQEA